MRFERAPDNQIHIVLSMEEAKKIIIDHGEGELVIPEVGDTLGCLLELQDATSGRGNINSVPSCEWPNCKSEALCRTGNFEGRLVCSYHFEITNGLENPVWGCDPRGDLKEEKPEDGSGGGA